MKVNRNDSIIGRITAFCAVVSILLCTLLAIILLNAVHRYASSALASETRADGGRVAATVETRGHVPGPLAQQPQRNVQVVDHQGNVVESTPALRGKPRMATFTADRQNTTQAVVCGGVFGEGNCSIVVAQSAHRPEGYWTIYSSSPAIPMYVDSGLAALVGGSAIVLITSITYLGNRIVTAALRPVNAIRRELDEINASNIARRVPVPARRDEIRELADTINHTLTRLDAAMTQQRQFASDASHDLRSPITAIHAELEDALLAPQDTSVSSLSSTIMNSVKRLEAIVCDLLTITKLDAGAPAVNTPVDLAALVEEECQMRPQGTKKFLCHLERGIQVCADRQRLGRLLTNLLDNADRHADSTITITVRHEPDSHRPAGIAVLEVQDDGPGVDPSKREFVFQRFARLDEARNKDAGGSGLGLPIARQIAEAACGSLRIEDSARGARFVLRLPCHAQDDITARSAAHSARGSS
ncbi:sensor histidine kinase [Nonomuraea maritima]|uniref:sensor histidine kinase n=1 Tax=Nonomuraea maritima TaxID=683260 RepID=UPI003714190B